MVAGPSILTTIMLYAHQEGPGFYVAYAILIAWILSVSILLFAQQIKNIVGRRALIAVERLMGLLLTMMAVEMLLKGLQVSPWMALNKGIIMSAVFAMILSKALQLFLVLGILSGIPALLLP